MQLSEINFAKNRGQQNRFKSSWKHDLEALEFVRISKRGICNIEFDDKQHEQLI